MGRIVVNKHFDSHSQITKDNFVNKGELIISNQVGFEGIAIINKNGEMVFIGPTSGAGSEVSTEYKEYIETYVNEALGGYMTSAETIALIGVSGGTIDEEYVQSIVSGSLANYITIDVLTSALTEFVTIQEVENIVSANTLTEEQVEAIAAMEVAKVVASADTSFDTLKEIADWIINDSTSAAVLTNNVQELSGHVETIYVDIANLSGRVDTISSDVTTLSGEVETLKTKLSGLTSDDIYDVLNDKTQSEINQIVLQGSAESSKHFFMSTDEYATLIANGEVTVNGELIVYDENAYYALYESEE